jgi:hypothetical protein
VEERQECINALAVNINDEGLEGVSNSKSIQNRAEVAVQITVEERQD